MQTYHIHINGIVQGIGFRPKVYKEAKKFDIYGFVKNTNDGLHIVFNANEENAQKFYNHILTNAPSSSRITSSSLTLSDPQLFFDFKILYEVVDVNTKKVFVAPDYSTCPECRKELYDKENRRYRYPFITCTDCGPRYSILTGLPYDRAETTMNPFEMCILCRKEYENVEDRRFYSQTNSCGDCGIKLSLWEKNILKYSGDNSTILDEINKELQLGKILAVKGVGGYLLLCDAANKETIQLLRKRKHRPAKPFAVLFPEITMAEQYFELSTNEKLQLQSFEAPILLLNPRHDISGILAKHEIAPGLRKIGVMLASGPLLELITSDFGRPVIATSANISGSPILYEDNEAGVLLNNISDILISFDRAIVVPQDDSVLQYSKLNDLKNIIRRSRGFAPVFMNYRPLKTECLLAMGAHLKSTFSLSVHGNVFLSQFLGSGESYESQLIYRKTLHHCLSLYSAFPALILTDLHPAYFSHTFAQELAGENGIDVRFIQHHEAHFAAVLAENDLIYCPEKILGVIWDGTGLGSDGNIWGGEFFIYKNLQIKRQVHFEYFPVIAGDKFSTEPRLAALSLLYKNEHCTSFLKSKFSDIEWLNFHQLLEVSHLFSSSVGRLFDAVACLLTGCDKQTYEGEAALKLQVLAESYFEDHEYFSVDDYLAGWNDHCNVPTSLILSNLVEDLIMQEDLSYISAKFHVTLTCVIDKIARINKLEKICFSGGVFQNTLLTDILILGLSQKYSLYFHVDLPNNDENISFGQLVFHDQNLISIN